MTETPPAGYEDALLRFGQAATAAVLALIAAGSLITLRIRWPQYVDALLYPGIAAFVLAGLVSRRVARPVLSLMLVQTGVLLVAAHGLLPIR